MGTYPTCYVERPYLEELLVLAQGKALYLAL